VSLWDIEPVLAGPLGWHGVHDLSRRASRGQVQVEVGWLIASFPSLTLITEYIGHSHN
jgi:hypothetical protein